MKHKSTWDMGCAVARSLDVIGDSWSLLIIRDALMGKRRFGEFQKSLGLAKNILAARLKKLVSEGILEQVAVEGAPYHDYLLTEKGRGLYVVLSALWQWGEANLFAPGELERGLVDAETGGVVPRIELKAADGRVLGADDIRLTAPAS